MEKNELSMVAAGLGHRQLIKPGWLVFIREVAADRSSGRSSDPDRWIFSSHSALIMNQNTHLQGGSGDLLYWFTYGHICPNILENVSQTEVESLRFLSLILL